jgi:uncharacterized membrane protein YphA (DoxX/SURF4 family)
LRIFFGVAFLANGAAKLIGGSWVTNLGFLYDRNASLAVLRESLSDHPIGPYRDLVQSVIVANWDTSAPLIGLGEVVIGALLVLGVGTRPAAVAGALFALNLQVLALSGGHWLFQHALVWLPLLAIAYVGGGRSLRGLVGRRPDSQRVADD